MEGFSYDTAFGRNIGVLTPEAQQLLKDSCIAIAGVGGVGGTTAEQLARMGAGYLKIADHDVFEMSNLNRQVGSAISTLGKKKANVLYKHLKDINPELHVDSMAERVGPNNLSDFLKGADVVIDMVDYFSPDARLAIHKEAIKAGLYVISTPATGFGATLMCFDPDGMTIEDFLEYPRDPEQVKNHRLDARKLMGCELKYLPDLFWKKFSGDKPYPSTVSPSVTLAGCLTATQALKVLMHNAQQENPSRFREYGQVEITVVPKLLHIDTWDLEHCCITDFGKKR